MSQTHKPDPYASDAETDALLTPDTRTSAERTLDTLLDAAGYGEQGADPVQVLRRVALALVEQMAARVPLTHAQCVDICSKESWGPGAISMNASLLRVIRRTEAAHGITKGST